jgi:hypothetical protein
MTECPRHGSSPLPDCYWCRTGTEPGSPFIPDRESLDAGTEEALARAREMAAGVGGSHVLDGIVSIIAVQFPDVPAAVLGRVVLSSAMAAGAVLGAAAVTGAADWDGGDVVNLLAMAGARLAGEDAPHA